MVFTITYNFIRNSLYLYEYISFYQLQNNYNSYSWERNISLEKTRNFFSFQVTCFVVGKMTSYLIEAYIRFQPNSVYICHRIPIWNRFGEKWWFGFGKTWNTNLKDFFRGFLFRQKLFLLHRIIFQTILNWIIIYLINLATWLLNLTPSEYLTLCFWRLNLYLKYIIKSISYLL